MNATYIFAVTEEDGRRTSNIYDGWDEYHRATFSPDLNICEVYPLELHGKTYRERRENLRDLAIGIQLADDGGLSYAEFGILGDFFHDNGRRYGLLTEFRENGICC